MIWPKSQDAELAIYNRKTDFGAIAKIRDMPETPIFGEFYTYSY